MLVKMQSLHKKKVYQKYVIDSYEKYNDQIILINALSLYSHNLYERIVFDSNLWRIVL